MILFPNCKINLGLRVTGKRPDGYHNIETVFYPLPLKDAAEIIRAPQTKENFELTITGSNIPGGLSTNLCRKAWELIKTDFPQIPPVKMFLHKAIPVGAGLGGGSSNGAFTLVLLNKELQLGIPDEKLRQYALQLGSDCPFFILNKPCLATGRGEVMQEINVDLEEYYFILVDSGIHVSTAWAFGQLSLNQDERKSNVAAVVSSPVEIWKNNLVNDFEIPVFEAHPLLKNIKEELYGAGAIFVSLTGTGSCIYGIFHKKTAAPRLGKNYTTYYLNRNS